MKNKDSIIKTPESPSYEMWAYNNILKVINERNIKVLYEFLLGKGVPSIDRDGNYPSYVIQTLLDKYGGESKETTMSKLSDMMPELISFALKQPAGEIDSVSLWKEILILIDILPESKSIYKQLCSLYISKETQEKHKIEEGFLFTALKHQKMDLRFVSKWKDIFLSGLKKLESIYNDNSVYTIEKREEIDLIKWELLQYWQLLIHIPKLKGKFFSNNEDQGILRDLLYKILQSDKINKEEKDSILNMLLLNFKLFYKSERLHSMFSGSSLKKDIKRIAFDIFPSEDDCDRYIEGDKDKTLYNIIWNRNISLDERISIRKSFLAGDKNKWEELWVSILNNKNNIRNSTRHYKNGKEEVEALKVFFEKFLKNNDLVK